jgi:hypothetical protein
VAIFIIKDYNPEPTKRPTDRKRLVAEPMSLGGSSSCMVDVKFPSQHSAAR